MSLMGIGDAVANHIVEAQARFRAMAVPKIETHLYQTPTANNREVPYSLGLMNMTRAEAESVVDFVRMLQRQRTEKSTRPNPFVDEPERPIESRGRDWVGGLRDAARRNGLLMPDSSTTDTPGDVRYSPSNNTSEMWTGREWVRVEIIADTIKSNVASKMANEEALRALVTNPPTREQLKGFGIDVDKLDEAEQIAAPTNRFSELDIE